MKVATKDLKQAIEFVLPICKKSGISEESAIRFTLSGDHLTIAANNFQQWASKTIKAEGEDTEFFIHSGLIGNFLNCAAEETSIDTSDHIVFKSGKAKFKFHRLDVRKYDRATQEGETSFPVKLTQFINALRVICPVAEMATAQNPLLSWAYFAGDKAIGCSGHGANVVDFESPEFFFNPAMASAISAMGSGMATIRTGGKFFEIALDDSIIGFMHPEGRYPVGWRKSLFPEPLKSKCLVDRKELASALSNTVSVGDVPAVTLESDGSTLTASGVGLNSDSQISMDCEGDSFTIKLNSRYLKSALALRESEKVTLEIGEAKEPLIIRDEFLSIIMPQHK